MFGKIDTNRDGSLSFDELTSALSASKKKHAHHHGKSGNQDPLLKALEGAYQKTNNLTASSGSSVSVSA